MKKVYFLFLLTVLCVNTFAQVFEKKFNWNLSTTQFAEVTACEHRSNGNNLIALKQSYLTGQGAAAIIELTPNGDTVWTKKFNREGTLYGENFITFIRELPDHSIFMAGYTHNSSGFFHAALWLSDSVGNITNYKQFAYNTYREITINDIDVAADGSIYFAGNYFDLFSGGVSYYTWTVPLYGKLNPDLSLAWGSTWGDTNHSNNNNNRGNAVGIKLGPDNNLIVLGSDAVDFNHGYLGTLQLAKVTPGGVAIWKKQRSLVNYSFIKSLMLDNVGNIYALTQLNNGTTNGNNHILEKFTSNGEQLWAKEFGSTLSENYVKALYNKFNNTLVAIGNYQSTANNTLALQTTFDTAGSVIQSKAYGEIVSSSNYFTDVTCTPNNYLFAGSSYTFGGLFVQSNFDGTTGCLPTEIDIQSLNYITSTYSTGIYHGGMNFTFTNYNPNYINNPITFDQTCFACSNILVSNNVNACNSYFVGGALQTSSGVFYDTLSTSGGCDSIIVTNLTVYQNPSIANAGNNQNVCITSGAINANTPVIGTGIWSVISGGGSIVNVNDPTTGINNLSPGNNILRWTISNGVCNSNYDEVTIFVGSPSSSTITASNCDSVTVNNVSYFSNGTYTQILQNSTGCDSVLTIEVSVINSSVYTINETACDSFNLNNQTYSQSGIYYQVLPNAAGCDSTITINLIVSFASDTLLNVNTCNEVYTLNNQSYSTSGIYTQNLQTASGCDSIITIQLNIVAAIDTSIIVNNITLNANQLNAQYQWFDCNTNSAIAGADGSSYTPIVNGNYSVIINLNGCADTSYCYTIYTVNNPEIANDTDEFEILPNPNKGIFRVKSNDMHAQLEIYNAQGALVYELKKSQPIDFIDLSNVSEGMYYARLRLSKGYKTKKIIINK